MSSTLPALIQADMFKLFNSRHNTRDIPVINADNDAGPSARYGPADGVMRLQTSHYEPASMVVHKSRQVLPCCCLWLVDSDGQL